MKRSPSVWAAGAFGALCLLSGLPLTGPVRDVVAVAALAAATAAAWDVEVALGLLLVYMPFRVVVEALAPGPIVLVPDVIVLSVVGRLVIRHGESLWPLDRVEWLSVVFVAFGLFATVHAHAHLSGAVLEVRDLFLFVLLYAALRRLACFGEGPSPQFWARIVPYALLAIAVVGLQGIVQTFVLQHDFLLPANLARHTHISAVNLGRPYGWVDNPNTFGELGFIALVLLWSHVRSNRDRVPIWAVIAALFFSAMVVLSYSRTAYLVALVTGVGYMLSRVRSGERVAAAGLLAAMAVTVALVPGARVRAVGSGQILVAAAPGPRRPSVAVAARHPSPGRPTVARRYPPKEFAVFSRQYFQKSAKAGRIHNLVVAVRLAKAHPLGTGLGTFGSSGSKVFGTTIKGLPRNFYADNNYIVILAETGMLGTLLFLLLGLGIFQKILRASVPISHRMLTLILFVGLTLMAVTGDAWEQFNLTVYPWVAFAVLIGATEGAALTQAVRAASDMAQHRAEEG